MTLTLTLPPEIERKLQARANATGQPVAEFVVQALEEKLRGEPTADELLAPFRKQVQDSGLTDEELDSFFDGVRDEIWQEKQRSSP
jgi:hypothetical protein